MLEKMEQKQVEKLGLLMTKELDKIEESIMMQQAMDKQLQNMEHRRQELFEENGAYRKDAAGGRRVVRGEERKQLTDSIPGLDGAIGNIRFIRKGGKPGKVGTGEDGTGRADGGKSTGISGKTVGQKASSLRKRSDGGPV